MTASLIDRLPIIVCETAPVRDARGEIIDLEWIEANQLMNETILPDGGSIVGLRVFEFDPNYRDSAMAKCVIDVINSGQPRSLVTSEGRAAKKVGKVIKTSIVPTERGALCCSHEITDIAEERDDALERHDLVKAACDNSLHGIVFTNPETTILYVNTALCRLLGYTEQELVGKNAGILFGVKEFKADKVLAEKIARRELIQHIGEATARSKTGEPVRVEAYLSSARQRDGELVFVSYLRDVREERKQAHALRDALHRAEQATRLKSEFLANMSHEIRTPLNGVLGMAQVLSHSPLSPAQSEQVSVILDSGNTLMVLLNDILDLSKIEAGQMQVSPVAGDLRNNLSGLFKLYETTAREKGIAVDLFVHPSVPSRLMFDPVRVRQCVGNLVSNAIKFTAEGKVLIVVASEPDGRGGNTVTVHVSDTGCGIAADKMGRIFESFAQEDGSTTRRFGGTGLGLSITRELARIMGGNVTAVSQQGKGSVFTLTFKADSFNPVILEPSERTTAIALRNLLNDSRGDLKGKRALVVDDNAINRRVARSFLELQGIQIAEAANGIDALDALSASLFDVVLMDVHMPTLDGSEALRRLRAAAGPNRQTPVLALTADSMQGDRERLLSIGFDGYVSKPIEERVLVTAITQILSRSVADTRQRSQAG